MQGHNISNLKGNLRHWAGILNTCRERIACGLQYGPVNLIESDLFLFNEWPAGGVQYLRHFRHLSMLMGLAFRVVVEVLFLK